jgi:hypothetical protein
MQRLIYAPLGVALATLLAGCSGPETALSALAQSSAKGKDGGSAAGKPTTPTDPNQPCDAGSPADLQCHEESGKDGLVCKVCLAAGGKEMARACSGGEPVPSPAVKCEEKGGDKGESCVVCIDAKGTVVKQICSGPTPLPPPDRTPPAVPPPDKDPPGMPPPNPVPADMKCYDETSKDGVTCKVCLDPNGKEVARACSAPAPAPTVKCQVDRNEKGDICTICYDDKGTVVSQGCTAPTKDPPPPPTNP